MSSVSRFVHLISDQARTCVIFDGAQLMLPLGMNLAAALMCAGISAFRHTPVSGSARGPYCMMGACYDCLVEIDGETRQACMTTVSEGLIVNRVKYQDRPHE